MIADEAGGKRVSMFYNIFIGFILQILLTVGVIALFGFLISLCNKRFYANFGRHALKACYITGFVGTPVHELSHALMCLIFGHKITDIKLFQISDDGTLGYVAHTYNRKNIYHRIGNFFIGVAPIVCISALMYLAAYLLLPTFTASVSAVEFSFSDVGAAFPAIWNTLVAFFRAATTWQWWVFVLVGMLLALHMTLSAADIRGALSGLAFLLAAVFIVDLVLGLISTSLITSFTGVVVNIGCYLICFLTIALIISAFAVLLSFIPYFINRRR